MTFDEACEAVAWHEDQKHRELAAADRATIHKQVRRDRAEMHRLAEEALRALATTLRPNR